RWFPCAHRRVLRVPREGGHRRRRRRFAHLSSAVRRRGHGADLVRSVEHSFRLWPADTDGRNDDADGEQDRPDALQGRVRSGSGAWASGPEDCAPSDYQWGYNRMTTVNGLFGAGDTIGGSAHKFSAGSFTEGRLAGKAAVRYVLDMKNDAPHVDEANARKLEETVFK